jgi:hypothetical protein
MTAFPPPSVNLLDPESSISVSTSTTSGRLQNLFGLAIATGAVQDLRLQVDTENSLVTGNLDPVILLVGGHLSIATEN